VIAQPKPGVTTNDLRTQAQKANAPGHMQHKTQGSFAQNNLEHLSSPTHDLPFEESPADSQFTGNDDAQYVESMNQTTSGSNITTSEKADPSLGNGLCPDGRERNINKENIVISDTNLSPGEEGKEDEKEEGKVINYETFESSSEDEFSQGAFESACNSMINKEKNPE